MTIKTDRWDYWTLRNGRDASAITLYIALPLLGIFAHRSAPLMVGVAVFLLLLAHIMTRGRHWAGLLPVRRLWSELHSRRWFGSPILPALLLYYWSVLSLAWSLDPESGAKPLLTIALLLPAARLLSMELRFIKIVSLDVIMAAGIVLFGIYMIIEAAFDLKLYGLFAKHVADLVRGGYGAGFHDLARPLILISMVFWAIGSGDGRNSKLLIIKLVLFPFLLITLFLSVSQSVQLSFLAAALAGLVLRIAPRLVKLVFITMAVLVLIFPFLVSWLSILTPLLELPELGSGGQLSRIFIWEQYQQFILYKPVLGWGLGSDRILGEFSPGSDLAYLFGITRKVAHSHSFIMQLWTELGLVGAMLCAWLLIEIGRTVASWPQSTHVPVTQFLVGVFVYSAVSHQITQTWWLVTIAAGCVPFLMMRLPKESAGE